MKDLLMIPPALLLGGALCAQALPQTIQRPDNVQDSTYIVGASSGAVELVATGSVTLRPGSWIMEGSDFHALVTDDPYTPPAINDGPGGENYIYARSYQKPMPDGSGITSNGDVLERITYFDGLGRPVQDIAIKASRGPLGEPTDIVTHMGYDAYGRTEKEFLPYEAGGLPGSFRADAPTATGDYYKLNYPDDIDPSAPNPFSKEEFEPSPLNRALKQAAPGEAWQLGNGHEIRYGYGTNATGEVRRYDVTTAFADNTYTPTLLPNGHYTQNELYKTVTRDENWQEGQTSPNDHTTEEFTDKQGRTVLKRAYNYGVPHDTYYIYDDFGNLTYVIPPKADTSDGVDATELEELCYQYKYDHRNRLVEKKLPGKGTASDWEEIVYDRLDRPIMARDPNLKALGKWLFTRYDVFGRVAYTGMADGGGRIAEQSGADGFTGVQRVSEGGPITIDNEVVHYGTGGYPEAADITGLHTINYYDGYSALPAGMALPAQSVLGQALATDVRGLPAIGRVRVLGKSSWINTATLYDRKGRPVHTQTRNGYLGTEDITETKLDFAGKAEKTVTSHRKDGGSAIVTSDNYGYDHAARLKKHEQVLGGRTELIAANEYDGIGRLSGKKVGNTEANPLQDIDYEYNIRGWLTKLNEPGNMGDDLFGLKLNYDRSDKNLDSNGYSSDPYPEYFDGNIGEIFWRTANDAASGSNVRGYSYRYDAMDRITDGLYYEYESMGGRRVYTPGGNTRSLIHVNYDRNGNIRDLKRIGQNGYRYTDLLDYSYFDSGNRLRSVSDGGNDGEPEIGEEDPSFYDGNTSGDDYAYDANGNMVRDLNKGIGSSTTNGIAYNHLNLPSGIIINDGNGNNGTISYIYDATGTKLQKNVLKNGETDPNVTDYAGNYIYENGTLKQISQPEGYIEPNGSSWQYVYRYTDIWGNTRITYADDNNDGNIDASSEIRREQNYYPFGLEHKGYNNVSYGVKNNLKTYQGQEFTEDLGLDTHEWKYRMSDPAIGRFWQVDPLAEKYPYNSTYAFQENKLGIGVELEGLEVERFDEGVDKVFDGASRFLNEASNIKREMDLQGANGSEAAETAQQERLSNISETSTITKDGLVEASKGATKIVGSGLQDAGDAGTLLALAAGQPEIALLTDGVSNLGTVINFGVDLSDGNYGQALMSAGTNAAFGKLGEQGLKASRKAAGEKSIKAGETIISDTVITGTTMTFAETFKFMVLVHTGIQL